MPPWWHKEEDDGGTGNEDYQPNNDREDELEDDNEMPGHYCDVWAASQKLCHLYTPLED